MNKLQTFQEYLSTQSSQVPVLSFGFNLFIAAILGFALSIVYVKYGRSLSNRKKLAGDFVMLVMTTMVVITIVKSSLALSLGLVGALSIVRFRAAIKEPEELIFLFFAIAIGLGLGADQTIITVLGFVAIFLAIWLKSFFMKKGDNQNLYLTVSSCDPEIVKLSEIVNVLKTHCRDVYLKRFDETQEMLEAAFLVTFDGFAQLDESKLSLQKISRSIQISFLDNKGIGG